MWTSLVRDAPLGQVIRCLSRDKYLRYSEEIPDFAFPKAETASSHQDRAADESITNGNGESEIQEDVEQGARSPFETRPGTSIHKEHQDHVLVDWYGPHDPENPLNWSASKKSFVTFIICLYTFVVYCASAIFVPSAGALMFKYGVSETTASVGLAIYVAGYGLGPMFFSPLSEIAVVGRNPPYVISFVLFFIISIVTAVVDNFSGLMVLRFLQGLLGSPALASGGASIQDLFTWSTAPYGFILWVAAMYCGPALGPVLSGFAVSANWRWPLWEIVIMSGPVLILMIAFLPETSALTILHYRAQRLRKVTGDVKYKAQSDLHKIHPMEMFNDAMIKPLEIAIKDPAMGFVCVYSALVYAIYYSFFEAFQIVYMDTHGMTLGQMGLVFLSIIIGCVVASVLYGMYLNYVFMPRTKGGELSQESRLLPALLATWFLPASLFLFAWTARSSIHWIVPTIGIFLYAASSFVVFQCIIVYVPLSYPRYVASLFAASDFTRAWLAAGTVMFSRAMYINLGIDKGVTLLAGLSFMGIIGMYFLYFYGAKLRAMSKFAES